MIRTYHSPTLRTCCLVLLTVCFGLPAFAKAPVSLDLKNPGKGENQRLKPYMILLRKRIQASWRPAPHHECAVKVHYIIGADGSLIELITESSSRSIDFDNSAKIAIQSNAPFPPPPVPHSLVITATFDGNNLCASQAEPVPPLTGTQAPHWHQTNTFSANDQARMTAPVSQDSQNYLPDVSPDPNLSMSPISEKRLSALSAGKEMPASRSNAFPPIAPPFGGAGTAPTASTSPEQKFEGQTKSAANRTVVSKPKSQKSEMRTLTKSSARTSMTEPRPFMKPKTAREVTSVQKNAYPRSWKAGDVAEILNPLSIGAVDIATFKDYWRSFDIGDTHGAATYIYSGKMVSLNRSTKVLILDVGSNYYRVRIRDIEHDLKNHNRVFFIKQSDIMPGHKSAVEQFRENMKRLK